MPKTLWIPLCVAFSSMALGCEYEVHYEDVRIDEAVKSIVIDVGSGDVRLTGADVSDVDVSARIEGASNHLGHTLSEDGRLVLFDDCDQHLCGVSIRAVIPEGVPVEVRTGSGNIDLWRLLGSIDAQTGSGDIEADDIAGIDTRAETGSGDVLLGVSGPVEKLRVKTGSGDVELRVESGSYRLDISTGSGDRKVSGGITNDDSAPGSIAVRTGSGDVRIHGR